MKAKSAIFSVLVLACGTAAWAGKPADEFRQLMVDDLKFQLPHSAVANLRGQLDLAERQDPKEDWAPVEAEVGRLEKFYHDYILLQRPGPTQPQDLVELKRKFVRLSDDLNYRDPGIEAKLDELFSAQLKKVNAQGQAMHETAAQNQAAVDRKVEALKNQWASTGAGPVSGNGVALGGNERPAEGGDFNIHAGEVRASLDKTVVPAPGSERKPQSAAPPKPAAKRNLTKETEMNAGEAVVGLLCLFSTECQQRIAVEQMMNGVR